MFSGSALVFIPVLGMFAIPEILGGKDDWLVGNLIEEASSARATGRSARCSRSC